MGEAKFTPGPWIAHRDERSEEWSARLPRVKGAAGQVFMCEVAGPWDHMEANAHLIAAAPELYDALGAMALTAKALINSLEGTGPTPLHMIEAGIREIRAALEMADKATRKAEGRG